MRPPQRINALFTWRGRKLRSGPASLSVEVPLTKHKKVQENKRGTWIEESMKRAIHDVSYGIVSLKKADEQCNSRILNSSLDEWKGEI